MPSWWVVCCGVVYLHVQFKSARFVVASIRDVYVWRASIGNAAPYCLVHHTLGNLKRKAPLLRTHKLNKNIQVPSYSDFRLVFDIV